MFYLRLNKVRILNNRERLGKAEIELLSLVSGGESDFPMLAEFFETNNETQKQNLVEAAMQKMISARKTPPMYKIKDGQTISFGPNGLIVHKSENIPADFNWTLLVIERDVRTRANANFLEEKILTKDNISQTTEAVAKLAALSNPVTAATSTIFNILAPAIYKAFQQDRDDQVGLFLTSFVEKKDYPFGKLDHQDVVDTTGNMFVDYTVFSYQDVIK